MRRQQPNLQQSSRNRRRGNATIEMTLVGIPLIFVLISIFEMARGMWVYHTLAYAIKEGTRYTIVHGVDCSTAPNACSVTVGQIAAKIRDAGVGLDPGVLQVRMQSLTDDTSLQTLTNLLSNASNFPTGAGASRQAPITFTAQYSFSSAISLFWPGAGRGIVFPTFTFPASSQESIQF